MEIGASQEQKKIRGTFDLGEELHIEDKAVLPHRLCKRSNLELLKTVNSRAPFLESGAPFLESLFLKNKHLIWG